MNPDAEKVDVTLDNMNALLAGVAAMFYRPLVIAHGWEWHVAAFWDVPSLAYWHVFGLLALRKSMSGYRKDFAPSTATGGRIATIALIGLGLSHMAMWLVR